MLAIMWSTTQRPGCVFEIEVANVTAGSVQDCFCILFKTGKGVKMRRRPFVTHTSLWQWNGLMIKQMKRRKNELHLFNQSTRSAMYRSIAQAMKTFDQRYEMRSVRRGAIEQLAKYNDPESLMKFTGHASTDMVMRYLRWGVAATFQGAAMEQASRVLQ